MHKNFDFHLVIKLLAKVIRWHGNHYETRAAVGVVESL